MDWEYDIVALEARHQDRDAPDKGGIRQKAGRQSRNKKSATGAGDGGASANQNTGVMDWRRFQRSMFNLVDANLDDESILAADYAAWLWRLFRLITRHEPSVRVHQTVVSTLHQQNLSPEEMRAALHQTKSESRRAAHEAGLKLIQQRKQQQKTGGGWGKGPILSTTSVRWGPLALAQLFHHN